MPSPVGHGFAGLAVCGLWAFLGRPPARPRRTWAGLGFFAAVVFAANAPDLDFLPGILIGDPDRFHHGPAHSLGAALLFGLASALGARLCGLRAATRIGVLLTLAFSSHLLLDLFSLDRRPPSGVPVLWPLSDHYFAVAYPLFFDIKRQSSQPNFFLSLVLAHNGRAVLWELVVMGQVAALSWLCVYARHGLRIRPRAPWRRARRRGLGEEQL